MATWIPKIGKGFKPLVGFQPCLLQRRPYEVSEGIYPVKGKEKTGVGKGFGIRTIGVREKKGRGISGSAFGLLL
jgi:hypothetical protein